MNEKTKKYHSVHAVIATGKILTFLDYDYEILYVENGKGELRRLYLHLTEK
ncbi:MAG: hypothetical protein LBQ15_03000 [Clostridium sp.]|nr:hypothetical protein [Clostridium sp.]